MSETSEKIYLDSLFRGVSVISAPVKDTFEKNFAAKNFKTPLDFSGDRLSKAFERLGCSAENFFMGAYSLLLARFAGADEVFFAAAGEKKFPSL